MINAIEVLLYCTELYCTLQYRTAQYNLQDALREKLLTSSLALRAAAFASLFSSPSSCNLKRGINKLYLTASYIATYVMVTQMILM